VLREQPGSEPACHGQQRHGRQQSQTDKARGHAQEGPQMLAKYGALVKGTVAVRLVRG